ncbi:MAG: hydroxyneurosporene methyltransferase [Acidobacteria bacterium]|nr:hydroxyneurosporene methyltransferase [Acidobacteriota bacterium]
MSQTEAVQAAGPTPQQQVLGLAIGVVQGGCVITAAELGLADAIANGPRPVEEIAAEVNANADYVFRVMRALETVGIFRQTAPRVFANTPTSEVLRRDVPGSQWAFLAMMAPGAGIWDSYGELTASVRGGTTAIFKKWGYDIWEYYRRHPDQWAVFNEAMRSITAPMTPAVTAAHDWSRYPVIADVAGGIGTQLVDILNAHPGCRGVLFDQAEVLATAIPHDRVEPVSGSFFVDIPVEADAYILRNIIHDWNDEDAGTILKTLRRATKPSARVMLVEWLIPDTGEFHLGKWTDITMMTAVSGRERTRGDFEKLFGESGFALEEVVPTASMFHIVVGRPVA